MGLQWAYRGMREEKVEKEKAFTMEQSMPLQAEKGSSKERTESELFCLRALTVAAAVKIIRIPVRFKAPRMAFMCMFSPTSATV